MSLLVISVYFFFNDTATTEIYTLSLHDALPILSAFSLTPVTAKTCGVSTCPPAACMRTLKTSVAPAAVSGLTVDRKSTRLNSSHANISYAVFCLKKKKRHMFSHYTHLILSVM